MTKSSHQSNPCPCGHPLEYAACCGAAHTGRPATDAEALMRSRYSAYVLGDVEYLLATWHPSTRPADLALDPAGTRRWLGLEVRAHRRFGEDSAAVEFIARSRVGGQPADRLHETSRFVREDGRWYYVDGEFVGRQRVPPAR